MIDDILAFNRQFVAHKAYEPYITSKYPDKKLAILSCMDTRLTELLPAALGIRNGDAKLIKNAGGVILHPFGSVMRSLLVAVYELGVQDVMVVAHTHCGACHMNGAQMEEQMRRRGISDETLSLVKHCGVDLEHWLEGFHDTEESVRKTVDSITHHPLMPRDVAVRGFIIDSTTGLLNPVD